MEEMDEVGGLMSEDEDREVAVRGTELSRYLQANFGGLVEWGEDSGRGSPILCHHQEYNTPATVDSWMLAAVQEVLHCDLLLDEDASYLSEVTSQVEVARGYKGSGEVFEILVSRCHVAGGMLVLWEGWLRLVAHRKKNLRLAAVTDICRRLRELHRLVRKTLQRLRERQASLASKEVVARLAGRNLRKLTEDSIATHALTECLIDMISASRKLTVGLISISPLPEDFTSVDLYLAHRNLPMPCTEDIPALERLKNIYLLMQSESLRRLGLAFSRPLSGTEPNRVFHEIHRYSNTTREISTKLERVYKTHFLSKTSDNTPLKTCSDPTLVDGYSAVHRFTRALNSVLVEARLIEESLAVDAHDSDILKWLENVENEFNDTSELLGQAKKYFLRLKSGGMSDPPSEPPVCPSTPTQNVDRILVGQSDFEPKGEDSVYVAVVTDSEDSNPPPDNSSLNYESTTLPRYVLSELEGALMGKRAEFESREKEAAMKNPDYETYLKFKETAGDEEVSKKKPDNNGSNFFGGFDLLRNVVAQSRKKNLSMELPEEEVYGSGSESEC